MKFLADESVERPVVDHFRAAGYDVRYVAEECRGADDMSVLGLAIESKRVLITNDKDFAELAFFHHRASDGIVLVRLPRLRSAAKASRIQEVLASLGDRLSGAMTVIEEHASRRRSLPSRA